MGFKLYEEILSNGRLNYLTQCYNNMQFDGWNDEFPIPSFKAYLLSESKRNSEKLLKICDESIMQESTKEGQKLRLSRHISEINFYLEKMAVDDFLKDEYSFFYDDLLNAHSKILAFYKHLDFENTEKKSENNDNRKIKWLGNTNQLVTLKYDLWKGQEKGRDKEKNIVRTKNFLEAEKKDLERLLIDNFIDKNNNPLSPSTISDYLNSSKRNKRLQGSPRIEL